MERLTGMNDKFQKEQDLTYRDQLQKVQFEINLVQRFDPYDKNALDSASDLRDEHQHVLGPMINADGARSMVDMAGVRFPEFLDDLEDLIELRDFQLAQSKVSLNNDATSRDTWQADRRFSNKGNQALTIMSNRMNTNEKSKNIKTHTPTRSKRRSESTAL